MDTPQKGPLTKRQWQQEYFRQMGIPDPKDRVVDFKGRWLKNMMAAQTPTIEAPKPPPVRRDTPAT